MSSVLDDINKKRKTLLKDVKGEPIGVIRKGYNENRALAREYGEETFYKPGKTYLISTEGGDSAEGWKADMAKNREKRDKLFKKSGSDVAVYGVKVAEDDRRLPESVAYLDGTMPKKQQTPAATKEEAPVVKKEVPAVKKETPAAQARTPTPAAQPVTETKSETTEQTPVAQSRYDKAIAYINEASKSPSRRERRDIRKMEKAAKKLIEDGKIREPIAFERDLDEVEVVADKNPTPQTPAQTKSTMPWVMPGQSATRSAQETVQGDMANPDVMQGLFNNINTTQTGHAAARRTSDIQERMRRDKERRFREMFVNDIRRMAKERGTPNEYWRTTTQTLAGENVGLRPEAQESAPVTPAKETSTPAAQATAEQPVTETKPETTEQTPAPKEQPVENGEYIELNGKRYKKVNFDEIPNNHAAARNAGYVLFKKPNGQITWANETEDINELGAFINGAWYEVVDNPIAKAAGRTFATVQPAATTAQQEAAKDDVTVQPASKDTPEQMTYTELLKRFYSVMTPEEKAEQQRRQRNRQIINAVGDGISALANLYYTNKSGVNAYDPSTSLTKAAKERYDKLLAQQREDENRYKELAYRSGVADLEAEYRRQRDAKADARAEAEAEYKRQRDEIEAGYKKRKEDREIAESNARIKKDEAQANFYNNGGKKPSTSGRGSTGSTGSKDSITLINDDGTKRTFRKADSVDYISAAYAALPNEYKKQAKDSFGRLLFDKNGNPVYDDVNQQQMLNAIANYNARKRQTAKASSKKNGGNKTSGKKQNPMSSGKKQNPMN